MASVREVLVELNPWWKGEFKLDYCGRELYAGIRKFMPARQIISLVGLRRVGKTTLMLKLVQDALEGGMGARNIVFFSFDEFPQAELRGVVAEFEALAGKDFADGKYLLLLDEVQKLEGWEGQLKALYDLRKNVKIIISGSESLFIRAGTRETLAGRMFEFHVKPLSFREFLSFKRARFEPMQLYEKELRKLLAEFALTMGFPELVGNADKEVVRKYVRESVVERIIFRDLPRLLGIRQLSLLESVLRIIMDSPGELVEVGALARQLGASRHTISAYLDYLEHSFLVKKLYNYSKNARKTERKLRKYYPTVPSPELLFREEELSRSRVFEWLVVTELGAEFFWRDAYKNEVDAVLAGGLPVEAKSGRIETKGIEAFLKKFGGKKGWVVTEKTEETIELGDKIIFVVPAHKLFLEKQKVFGGA